TTSISSATTSTIVSSTTDGCFDRCGVSRRARWMRSPSAPTTPPATLVPPMSIPMASPRLIRGSSAGPGSEVGGTDHAGVVPKAGQGEAGLRTVPATGQLATERGKGGVDQQAPCLGHPTSHDDQLGVQDGGNRGQALTEPGSQVGQQLIRRWITLSSCPG